jgi:long-chain fatty acid transport protein
MRAGWPALLLVAASTSAHAGGMSLPFHGVRPTGRGGAFVAGADDAGALFYNPAGLAALAEGDRTCQVLADGALAPHRVDYARIDSGGNKLPPVSNDPQVLPLPTLAVGIRLGRHLVLGIGAHAPYGALDHYPEDGPQRYSLVTTRGSLTGVIEAGLAWRVSDWLSVGAAFQNLMADFRSRLVFSACPSQTVCAPEDPEFDAIGEFESRTLFTPSALFGAQASLAPWLRLGAAFQLPFRLRASGDLRVRLPSSDFYDGARVEGDRGDSSLAFPSMLRVGAELRPAPRLRVEAGFDWESWSQQDTLEVRPRGVRIANVAGVGTYEISPLFIPRNLRDTYALRVGLEAEPIGGAPLVLRAGWIYETGASRSDYLSVYTVDTAKHVATLGLGWRWGAARLDAAYAHVFMADGEVPRGTSCVPVLNPIRTGQEPTAGPAPCVHDDAPDHVYVGDGTYRSSWDVFGLGLALDL